ncbi:hypothetical protein SCHPADRAFT_904635 [Schizopora paradoxa]|uniref:Uncharacterized protein n=1 Tax=Schizopora paradoxa TaxID=27342 RepID=A0A0H2RM30_9AGAM|nr:hypothetical protein SCHPADRAFT_904635 [Schizopora paradoxa]
MIRCFIYTHRPFADYTIRRYLHFRAYRRNTQAQGSPVPFPRTRLSLQTDAPRRLTIMI